MPVVRLRQLLREHFLPFERVAIVGGLVRDFARYGKRGFHSDVDLVIHAPRESVAALARQLDAQPNRFGGYGYHHPLWKIDFWALETTWAVTSGNASASSLADMTTCTFFDCDAILYDLKKREILADSAYFDRLNSNKIEISLRPNPSIDGNLLRAVRRLLCWSANPGDRLADFISEHLTDDALARISATEARLYANRVLHDFDDAETLKAHIFDSETRLRIDPGFGKQLRLPGF